MSISNRVRFEVFKRDNFRCKYCGAGPDDGKLEVDHMVPRAAGGGDDMENLITACKKCNRGKSDIPLPADEEHERLRAYYTVMGALYGAKAFPPFEAVEHVRLNYWDIYKAGRRDVQYIGYAMCAVILYLSNPVEEVQGGDVARIIDESMDNANKIYDVVVAVNEMRDAAH